MIWQLCGLLNHRNPNFLIHAPELYLWNLDIVELSNLF